MNKELEQRNQAPVVKGKDIHRWNAKEMMQILQNFCKDESAADAKITVALPRGRAHDQDNFHIAEITNVSSDNISKQIIKSLKPYTIDNNKKVRMPGQSAMIKRKKAIKAGIILSPETNSTLEEISKKFERSFRDISGNSQRPCNGFAGDFATSSQRICNEMVTHLDRIRNDFSTTSQRNGNFFGANSQ